MLIIIIFERLVIIRLNNGYFIQNNSLLQVTQSAIKYTSDTYT